VNCEGINDDRDSYACGHVAEALNEDKIHYCLLVSEPGIYGNVDKVGLDRYLGRHRTVERRNRNAG